MESPMPSVSSMSSIPSPPEMKPDITTLNSPTSTQGGTGFSPSSTQQGPPHGFFPHSMQTTASQMSHMPTMHMSSQMSPTGNEPIKYFHNFDSVPLIVAFLDSAGIVHIQHLLHENDVTCSSRQRS